jgi:hypothetical protein
MPLGPAGLSALASPQRLQLGSAGHAACAFDGHGVAHDAEGLGLDHQIGARGDGLVGKSVARDADAGYLAGGNEIAGRSGLTQQRHGQQKKNRGLHSLINQCNRRRVI